MYIIPFIAAVISAYFFFCDKSDCDKKTICGLYYNACAMALFSAFTLIILSAA